MTDLITDDQSLFIEGKSTIKTRSGGLLSIVFLIASAIIIYFLASDAASAQPVIVEYTVNGDRSANNIDVPSLRIVYGFPSSNASNIEVILNTAGVETVIDLQDYPDQDWNEHFNFTKDPTLVYKYQDWPASTSFTSVRQIVPTNPTTITPTPWYCIEQTGQTGPLRLNQYGDVECFSTDELNCHWNLFNNADCEAYIAENANQLNTLSCGQQHLELWDMTGYDSPTHWCSTTLTYLMGIYGNQPFLTWDNTLTGKQIFVAVEEYRFNPGTRQIQKTNKILSEIGDPNNYVVYLERTISNVRVFQGSYKTNDEVLYNHYTSNLADFVRKLPPEEIFHFNIIEPEELFLDSDVKEYTYALTLDVIAQIASLIEVVFGVLVIINDIFDNYIMATLLYKYIYLSKHSRVYDNIKKEETKQKLMATKLEEFKNFTFWNYIKCKFLKCLCKSQELKKLQASLEEIARLSSMEEFLAKDDTKEEQSSVIKRMLTNFDLFPSKQNFYIKGDKKFGHTIGMLLSMLYLLIVPVAFYFIGTDFLYRQYPLKTVVPSDLAIDTDLTNLYVAVPIMLYYPKEIEPVDYVLYNMQTSRWVNFTTAPTDCLDSEINDFNITGSPDMTYKCFDLTYLANQSTTTTDFTFGIESCITKGLCNILNPTYGFVMKSYNTDVDAKKDEYSQLVIQNAVTNRSSGNNLFTLTLNFLNWTEDTNIAMSDLSNNDLFLYQDNTTFSFTPDTDSTLSSTDLTFQLTLSRETTVVTRVFPKFIITFKKTMYVVFLVYLILYILNTAFSDYFFMLIFKDLFFQKSKHQDKEEHFSLKNHFFNIINCCFRHKSEHYETVHKEMKDSLDIRTLFQKKQEKSEGDEELGGLQSPKDISPVKAKSFRIIGENSFTFLKSIDILPNNTKPFLIKGQPTFKTMVGGIFSVLCIVAFVILSYFTLLDFWYRTNPTVSQNNLNFGQSDLSFWVSPKSVAMIYHSMAEDYSPSFVLNAVAAERLYPISNDSCTDDDFQQLGLTRDPNYQYACVDIFETLGKVDTISNAQKRFFALSITSCPTWTSFSHTQYVGNGNYSMYLDRCASTSYTEYGKNVQVGFAAKFMDFDSNSASLLTNFINYNETNSDGDMMYSYVSVSENTLRDDVGVLTSDIKNYVFASSDSNSKLVRQGWNASTFGRLYVAFDEDTPYYIQKQRTYQKVADLAVQTTSIFSILAAVCQAIVNLFVDYLFIRHLSRYFIKSTNDLKKSKTFTKKTAKYGSNIQSSQQLGISIWSYFKFKLFRCRGKSTPYPDIINYASYERLFQNAMNNRIKLDMQTHKEQIDPSQIELAVGRSEFAVGGSEFAVGTGRSEFAVGRSELVIGQSEFAVGGSEPAVGIGRPEFAVERPEFAVAPSGFAGGPYEFAVATSEFAGGPPEFAVTPSRYAGEPSEIAVAPSGFAGGPSEFAGEPSDLATGTGRPQGIY